MSEKVEADLRRTVEFIIKVKGVYTRNDLLYMDWLNFFELLKEAEKEQAEQIARMEEKSRG